MMLTMVQTKSVQKQCDYRTSDLHIKCLNESTYNVFEKYSRDVKSVTPVVPNLVHHRIPKKLIF